MDFAANQPKFGQIGFHYKHAGNRFYFSSIMEKILEPTSIVGCSISLMFCLGAVVVLSCFREKKKPLLIKQQLSVSLVVIDIVILGGFQGVKNKEACRTVTTILHYGVLSCFSWLFADQYYNFKSVVKNEPICSFMRLCVLSWGFAIPFILIQIILGFVSSGRLGSKVYVCWNSDYIILTLAIPSFLLIMFSVLMLVRTIKTLLTPGVLTSFSNQKELQGIKYTVKTSAMMILLSTTIWSFGFLLFWYPDNVNYQLVFALGHGLQGLFNFFFHCVFALEQNMYVTTNRGQDEGQVNAYIEDGQRSTKMTDMIPELEGNASARKPLKKMSRIQLRKEPEIPSMVEEENIKAVESVVINNFEEISGTEAHSAPAVTEHHQQKTSEKIFQKKTTSNAECPISPTNRKPILSEKSEASSSGIFIETIQTPKAKRKDEETAPSSNLPPKPQDKDTGHAPNLSKILLYRNENSSSSINDNGSGQKSQSARRRESLNSTSSYASPCSRRTSRISGTGPFGMNELESLFNNPDLMKQTQERRSSNISNVTDKTVHSDSKAFDKTVSMGQSD